MTLLWFERVLEINGVVPWLSKGKSTSGFLREDVEVGVVTGRDEFLRCANWFLGWCLNLRLMNPFQGLSLVFLVKGGKMSSSVLKHETGTGTPVELYCALFPVYRWIVLLQPCVA